LMKVQDIAFEKPLELLLMKDQVVFQAFLSHAQEKTLTYSIGQARVRYGVRSIWMPLVVATRAK
jgi:hypothetical protein